jgi:hypothetical protein
LENLLAELKRRVEQDKEALRQWTALRKSTSGPTNAKNPALAARLLQFSRGCALALQFMSEDNPQVGLKGERSMSIGTFPTLNLRKCTRENVPFFRRHFCEKDQVKLSSILDQPG